MKAQISLRFPLLILAGATLLCCTFTSAAPQGVDSIVLNVLVTTEKGALAHALRREDFSVSIDKRPQNVLSFNDRELPASVGILIDRSGSLHGYGAKSLKQNLRQGLEQFVKLGHPSNEYFVLTFAATTSLLQDWTTDPVAAIDKIESLPYEGPTSLYDALSYAIPKVMGGRHSKHVLIVVSDGADNNSKSTFKEVRELLKKSDVILYAFGVQNDLAAGSALGMEAAGVLDELTSYTGGRTFFAETRTSLKVFYRIFELIAIELRSHYQLVISREELVGKQKWRKLKVRATRIDASGKPKELSVRTRQGYY